MSAIAQDLPGASVLDLFAGSGALGLEALSRGAKQVTFVENAPSAVRVLHQNLKDLGVATDAVAVRVQDALRLAETVDPPDFDIAFADPPYQQGLATRLAEIFVERPFAKILCIEHGRGEPLPIGVAARTRRYGDTLLTFLIADHVG